jgi:ABC-type branched-subunit amino acid transport system substrate-binding protein
MNSRSLRRFILSVLLLAAINPLRSEQPPVHSHREFKIGVLVSLTGSWNSLGQDTVAALQLGTLSSTPWYGSDGVAISAALTGDVNAAAFAASAGYPNPTFGLPDALQSLWQPVANAIEARTGITADAFALSAYDALFVVARALQDAGNLKDFAGFKDAFVNAANAYSGVTGSTALDSAGDRLNADFDFWAVRLTNGNYGWARIGAYTNGTLTLF